jgi:hypothetical protein
MLAAEQSGNSLNMRDAMITEIHRSKISLHRAKKGYDYPTLRLPHQFSVLAGLPTCIYQTVHQGALAFLVVIAPTSASDYTIEECENDVECSKTPSSHVEDDAARMAA